MTIAEIRRFLGRFPMRGRTLGSSARGNSAAVWLGMMLDRGLLEPHLLDEQRQRPNHPLLVNHRLLVISAQLRLRLRHPAIEPIADLLDREHVAGLGLGHESLGNVIDGFDAFGIGFLDRYEKGVAEKLCPPMVRLRSLSVGYLEWHV